MFELRWTVEASSVFTDLEKRAKTSVLNRKKRSENKSSKIEGLFKQIYKTINLLASNPRHPGLHTHEYSSLKHPFDAKQKVFEAYAQNNTSAAYRVFWCYGPNQKQITIITISAHP